MLFLFGLEWHLVLHYERFCVFGTLFIRLLGISDQLDTADIICWEQQQKQSSKRRSPIHISDTM